MGRFIKGHRAPHSFGHVLTSAASLILAASTSAAPYAGSAYEGFDYGTVDNPANDANDGDLVGNTGGNNLAGSWVNGAATPTEANVSPGTLAYPGLAGHANRLTLDARTNQYLHETFRNVGTTVDSGRPVDARGAYGRAAEIGATVWEATHPKLAEARAELSRLAEADQAG